MASKQTDKMTLRVANADLSIVSKINRQCLSGTVDCMWVSVRRR